MLCLILTTGLASAASNQLSLELGAFSTPDPEFSHFSENDAMMTWGARAGMALTDRTALVLDWQHGVRGGRVDLFDSSFHSAFTADQFGLGPKLDLQLAPGLHPYVTLQGQMIRGRVRLDEDIGADSNVNELKDAALAFGGLALAGGEIILGAEEDWIRPSAHLEMGYSYALPMKFDDFGELSFRGFSLRAGVGMHF